MAPKKKDDVEKAKAEIANDARVVGQAADRMLIPNDEDFSKEIMEADTLSHKDFLNIIGAGQAADRRWGSRMLPIEDDFGGAWAQTKGEVDDLDTEFSMMNKLREQIQRGDFGVRVMQIGPDGKLSDVSDKVSPKDLRPDQVERITTEDGREISRNPRSRAEALRLLQSLLLPGARGADLASERNSTSESIRMMEIVLAESDKILEHWKR